MLFFPCLSHCVIGYKNTKKHYVGQNLNSKSFAFMTILVISQISYKQSVNSD